MKCSNILGLAAAILAPIVVANPFIQPVDQKIMSVEAPDDFAHVYNLTKSFFDNFMWPKNAEQAKLVNSTFFADGVIGRVDVTRNFIGRELNTEYAFGLFSTLALNPESFTLLGVPINYTITHFASNQHIMSLAVIVDFNISSLNVISPVEVDFWATFNDRGEMDQYDATFRYLQWQFDWLYDVAREKLGFDTVDEVKDILHQKLAESICTTAMDNCHGEHKQYDSLEACFDFLADKTPLGDAYQLGFDTVMCRMVHQGMVPLRPETHCSHIGPTGGHYCTNDRKYVTNIREDLFKKQPFLPYGY